MFLKLSICSFVIFLYISQILCDDDIDGKNHKECTARRLLLFNTYYTLTTLKNFKTLPDNIYLFNNTIFYSINNKTYLHGDEQNNTTHPRIDLNSNRYIHYEGSSYVFELNGKLYIKKTKIQEPLLIFARKREKVSAFDMDIKRKRIFMITSSEKGKEGILNVLRVQDIDKYKNKCVTHQIPQMGRRIQLISIDSITGHILLGIRGNPNNFLVLLKIVDTDPCDKFLNISMYTRDFESKKEYIKSNLRVQTVNRLLPSIYGSFEGLLNELFAIYIAKIREALNSQKGNITMLSKEVDELREKVNQDEANRLILARQITYIIKSFEEIPLNTTLRLLTSKIPFEAVPVGSGKNYECALISDINEVRNTHRILSEEILENLHLLLSETVTNDEMDTLENVNDIFDLE